jgi:hypothetical protein
LTHTHTHTHTHPHTNAHTNTHTHQQCPVRVCACARVCRRVVFVSCSGSCSCLSCRSQVHTVASNSTIRLNPLKRRGKMRLIVTVCICMCVCKCVCVCAVQYLGGRDEAVDPRLVLAVALTRLFAATAAGLQTHFTIRFGIVITLGSFGHGSALRQTAFFISEQTSAPRLPPEHTKPLQLNRPGLRLITLFE